jgi:PAS domain S-box-containing protein
MGTESLAKPKSKSKQKAGATKKRARGPNRSEKKLSPAPSAKERSRLLVSAVGKIRDYAIFLLDAEGHVVTWNMGAERLKGYRESEIVGRHFSTFYTPEDLARNHPANELKDAKKFGRYEDEGWRVRKDGSRFWANVVITKLTSDQGRLLGFSKVTRDLSARRAAEQKLRESEERLQHAYKELDLKVRERTSDLASANEALRNRENELENALRLRDDFLSIASHELKTPITSLKMQLQMLRMKTKPEQGQLPSTEKLVKGLDISLDQVERLVVLIEQLLDVARSRAQKLSFHFERADLREIVREAVLRMEEHAQAARCSLLLQAAEEVVGEFDRFRMEQVVTNLLTNAFKYAPGTKVSICVLARRGKATIRVSDTGPGVPLASQAKIFERFERVEMGRHVSGLGLGLFISRQIVEGHGGSLRVESQPGQGASFIVEVPLGNEALGRVKKE